MRLALTSKERVMRVVAGQDVDRLPTSFLGVPEVVQQLAHHLGVSTEEDVLRVLGTDTRFLIPMDPHGYRLNQDGTYQDRWGIRYIDKKVAGGCYREIVRYPLSNAKTVDDLRRYTLPSPHDLDYRSFAAMCHQAESYATICGLTSVFWWVTNLRPMELVFLDFFDNEEFIHQLIKKVTDYFEECLNMMFRVAPGMIDFIHIADDYGTQNGLILSPSTWDKFFCEPTKRLIQVARRNGAGVLLHTCGSVYAMIDRFIEIGVDILDPVQTGAYGMQPEALKSKYGDRITFHGGIDTQHILPFGIAEGVREHVTQRIVQLGKGGRYVIAPCHNIQVDVPIENILALYEAAGSMQAPRL